MYAEFVVKNAYIHLIKERKYKHAVLFNNNNNNNITLPSRGKFELSAASKENFTAPCNAKVTTQPHVSIFVF